MEVECVCMLVAVHAFSFNFFFFNLTPKIMDLWISKSPTDSLGNKYWEMKAFFPKIKAIFYVLKQTIIIIHCYHKTSLERSHVLIYYTLLMDANLSVCPHSWKTKSLAGPSGISSIISGRSWRIMTAVIICTCK